LSRARQTLTSAALAPGTTATLAPLRDPERRPPALLRPIPADIAATPPPPPLHFTAAATIADARRTAKRGSAAGPSGATTDHYKVLQAEEEALALLAHAVTTLAAANVPAPVLALRLARFTALQKPSGGVRGIATGDAFRRLTSRVLAHHYAAQIDQATRPYTSTRSRPAPAGTPWRRSCAPRSTRRSRAAAVHQGLLF